MRPSNAVVATQKALEKDYATLNSVGLSCCLDSKGFTALILGQNPGRCEAEVTEDAPPWCSEHEGALCGLDDTLLGSIR